MKYPIGTRYNKKHGNQVIEHTIVDFLTTYNLAGEIVNERYVTVHEFCGQNIRDYNVPQIEIDRACWRDDQIQAVNADATRLADKIKPFDQLVLDGECRN